MKPVLPEKRVEFVVQGLSPGLGQRCQFGHQHRRDGAVFVTRILAHQVAVRFLRSEHEMVWSVLIDDTGNPFKAHL